MSTIAPELPLSLDSETTYKMMSTLSQATKQNFKCLILTSPGERIMDPDYGVGLRQFLFEPGTEALKPKITSLIKQKSRKYMPFIKINRIKYDFGTTDRDRYKLSLVIEYIIMPINAKDVLNIQVNI
tara:strand:+ start:367 stop:747 length:381 start_codon:yes stop_codon:yes gene_type:complete